MQNISALILIFAAATTLSVQAKTCLLIGDSQSSISTDVGFVHNLRTHLQDQDTELISYSLTGSSAQNWHDPAFNPLKPEMRLGQLKTSPETAIIPNLNANSSRSLFQQIIDHYKATHGQAPECVLFQLGDNPPRSEHVRLLAEQWQSEAGTSNECSWISPTWSQPQHPRNQYRFKTHERTVLMRREIETQLPSFCQHISSTGIGSEVDTSLRQSYEALGDYTLDGLHLNAAAGRLWTDTVIAQMPASAAPSPVAATIVLPADQPSPIILAQDPPLPSFESSGQIILPSEPEMPSLATPPSEVVGASENEGEESAPPPPFQGPMPSSEIQVQTEVSPIIAPEIGNYTPVLTPEGNAVLPAAVPRPLVAPISPEVEIPSLDYPQYQVFELACQSNLNMRVSSGTQYNTLGKIPCRTGGERTRVAVLEQDPDSGWMRILYNGQVAWVSGDYLRPTDATQELPRLVDGNIYPGELNCQTRLNFRAGPSTSHIIKGQFNCQTRGRPTAVQVIGQDPATGWYLIEGNGERGFVHPNFLTTHNQVVQEIADMNQALLCEDENQACVNAAGRVVVDCGPEIITLEDNWLPYCEVLAFQPNRPGDFDNLSRCFSSISDILFRGLNPNNASRSEVFRRMYNRLNSKEQEFLAMTLTSIGEAGIITPPLEEMVVIMKVIENRKRNARERGSQTASELDIALQRSQFSMYNAGIDLWRSSLRSPASSRNRRNAIEAYIQYQSANFTPSGSMDRVYHYHANYVRPNWRSSSKLVEPRIDGRGLRQTGTRHIFYRDIAWTFNHNAWSGKR